MDSPAHETPWERRLRSEWEILTRLVLANPARLSQPSIHDAAFHLTLLDTAAPDLEAFREGALSRVTEHRVRILFPEFFPAVPMELYLATAVAHPNIHPVSSFVCLWKRHQVSNTVEHALHKLVAILGWRLSNAETAHVMQQDAHTVMQKDGQQMAAALAVAPLQGIVLCNTTSFHADPSRRRRLS